MTAENEIILSTIPGSSDAERLLLVLCQAANEPSHLELRQQSFAAGLGWFNQSTVSIEPNQVAGLRMAFGSGQNANNAATLPKAFRRMSPTAWQPRLVHADSA